MRDVEMDRRCECWARWRVSQGGRGGLGYGRAATWAAGASSGYREAVIPMLDCEAEETDRAIQQLPNDLRYTVTVYYLDQGGMAGKAQKLGCSRQAIVQRVDRAHVQMSAWLAARRFERDRERGRVEALQRR